ncbi:MAG: hypothetical protein LWW85_04640 [Marinilabiliales bacterium]|nr:hypothetical protein [Marinilabiliales bacterium]
METKKKLRCPLGVPGGIVAALIGLSGIVCSLMHSDWHGFAISLALFLLAGPFVRITMMVHAANDRLDELERKNKAE